MTGRRSARQGGGIREALQSLEPRRGSDCGSEVTWGEGKPAMSTDSWPGVGSMFIKVPSENCLSSFRLCATYPLTLFHWL